jgi:hypothetical protein
MEVRINIDKETARVAIVSFLRGTTSLLNGVPNTAVHFDFYANPDKQMSGCITFEQAPEID